MRKRESNSDSDQDCDIDKYSDTFCCSSEFESTMSQSSHHSSPIDSFSPASIKRYSTHNQVLHSQAPGKPKSNNVPNRKRFHERFNSQSLPKIPLQKDSVVTKRILAARELKINELQNELTELHVKLDELIQENKTLKRLQYKQEKALNKFEDKENEVSQLIARHNNEITALKERLRKTQEKELATEKRMKDTEGELLRTKHSLQKLKKISEAKHLLERNDLAKKLVSAELKLDNAEKKIKELEKNLELSTSSFQRHLLAERKKASEAQDESKILQKELQQLQQKLKSLEEQSLLKTCPYWKDKNTEKFSKDDIDPNTRKERKANLMQQRFGTNSSIVSSENGNPFHQSKGNADLECEREKSAISQKEENSLLERQGKAVLETGRYHMDMNCIPNTEEWEEKRKREMLIAKLNEIDREGQDAQNFKCAPPSLVPDRKSKLHTPERGPSKYTFSEYEKVLKRSHIQSNSLLTTKDDNTEGNIRRLTSPKEFSFGSYVPSFAKTSGKSSPLSQMNIENKNTEKFSKDDIDPTTSRERKANLMQELFGTNNSIISSENGNPHYESKGNADLEDEREKSAINQKEENSLLERQEKTVLETGRCHMDMNCIPNTEEGEEKRKRGMFIPKLNEIDREGQDAQNFKCAPLSLVPDRKSKLHTPERGPSKDPFSESERVLRSHTQNNSLLTRKDDNTEINIRRITSPKEFSIGSYMPSFAKTSGKSSPLSQMNIENNTEKFSKDVIDSTTGRDRKSDVMQELFGTNSSIVSSENGNPFHQSKGNADLEHEREKSAINQKEENSLSERQKKAVLETGRCHMDMNCIPNTEEGEEKRKRGMLIPKLNEIDQEGQDAQNFKCAPPSLVPDRKSKLHTPERGLSNYTFSEYEKVLKRSHIQNNSFLTIKNDNTDGNIRRITSPKEFSFGSYVPSFAKTSGKSSPLSQMHIENNNTEKFSKDDIDSTTRRGRKTNLMQQLFDTNSSIVSSENGNPHHESKGNADPGHKNSKGFYYD